MEGLDHAEKLEMKGILEIILNYYWPCETKPDEGTITMKEIAKHSALHPMKVKKWATKLVESSPVSVTFKGKASLVSLAYATDNNEYYIKLVIKEINSMGV